MTCCHHVTQTLLPVWYLTISPKTGRCCQTMNHFLQMLIFFSYLWTWVLAPNHSFLVPNYRQNVFQSEINAIKAAKTPTCQLTPNPVHCDFSFLFSLHTNGSRSAQSSISQLPSLSDLSCLILSLILIKIKYLSSQNFKKWSKQMILGKHSK